MPSAPVAVRSGDVEFVYRQDSDFYYLTGFAEPDRWRVLSPGHPDGEFVMFVRPRDKERETWTGQARRSRGRDSRYGADKATSSTSSKRLFRAISKRANACITRSG